MKGASVRSSDSQGQPQRILFLGKRFYTNKDALAEQFGRVYQLPSHWAAEGSQVLLWLLDYHTSRPERRADGEFRIVSTPLFSFSAICAAVAAFRFKPGIVVASGDSYIGCVGWLLARLFGARFVFDVYDKYDEFAGYKKIFGFDLFGFLRGKADIRFFCSRTLLAYYDSNDGPSTSVLVLNGVDGSKFRPLQMSESRDFLDLPAGDVLIGYFGSMEAGRGVEDLLLAVELLRNSGRQARVLICGKSNPDIPLDKDWIIFRGMVAHHLMPAYLNAADVLVIPYRESPIMDMGASCKIAEYLMCKRPIVSTSTANFTGNFPLQAAALGAGLCPPGDPAALAAAIRYQLTERIVLAAPMDMSWSCIAAEAFSAMQDHSERVP